MNIRDIDIHILGAGKSFTHGSNMRAIAESGIREREQQNISGALVSVLVAVAASGAHCKAVTIIVKRHCPSETIDYLESGNVDILPPGIPISQVSLQRSVVEIGIGERKKISLATVSEAVIVSACLRSPHCQTITVIIKRNRPTEAITLLKGGDINILASRKTVADGPLVRTIAEIGIGK